MSRNRVFAIEAIVSREILGIVHRRHKIHPIKFYVKYRSRRFHISLTVSSATPCKVYPKKFIQRDRKRRAFNIERIRIRLGESHRGIINCDDHVEAWYNIINVP